MTTRKAPESRPAGYYIDTEKQIYHISRFDGPLTECNKAKEAFEMVSGDRQARRRDICEECFKSVNVICEFDR